MVDLREQYLSLKSEIDQNLADVLDKTHFIMGQHVHDFEAEVAAYMNVGHAISCANGTDALHLAMCALELGPGDEVITTPFTFIATAEAIAYVGATPVFVDIDPDTYNLDPSLVEAAITDRTRAIVPVHLFGMPCDMNTIGALAKKHDLRIIEDCAQSFGADINGAQTGTLGDIGCFSFFPSKNLGAFGDGDRMAARCATTIRLSGTTAGLTKCRRPFFELNYRISITTISSDCVPPHITASNWPIFQSNYPS